MKLTIRRHQPKGAIMQQGDLAPYVSLTFAIDEETSVLVVTSAHTGNVLPEGEYFLTQPHVHGDDCVIDGPWFNGDEEEADLPCYTKCPEPLLVGGCGLELVRPGKVQCDCDAMESSCFSPDCDTWTGPDWLLDLVTDEASDRYRETHTHAQPEDQGCSCDPDDIDCTHSDLPAPTENWRTTGLATAQASVTHCAEPAKQGTSGRWSCGRCGTWSTFTSPPQETDLEAGVEWEGCP